MADLDILSQLALTNKINFTGRLTQQNVVDLARQWMPNISFHEDEQFYPVGLEGLYRIPDEEFQQLPLLDQEKYLITVDGSQVSPALIKNGSEVFGSGGAIFGALENAEVNDDAVYTHGKSLEAAEQFFGSIETVSGAPNPGPTNPLVPRHDIVVMAEFRMLLETLKHELDLDELDIPGSTQEIYRPIDGIWEGFDIVDLLFIAPGDDAPVSTFTPKQKRAIIRAMVLAALDNDEVAEKAAIADIPSKWQLNEVAWNTVKNGAILEYHFIYAYNDFSRFGNWLYTNEHEGDAEGLCLVFDRSVVEQFAEDSTTMPLEQTAPFAMITLAHEFFHGTDEVVSLDSDPGDVRRQLEAFVARGSHATYPRVGSFDIYEFGANASVLFEGPNWVDILAGLFFPVLFPLSLVIEHFAGVNDQTSDDGITISSGPPDPNSNPLTHLQSGLVTTALSNIEDNTDENIYRFDLGDNNQRRKLAVRAYNGKLGAHDGLIDKSSKWENKTHRFFVRLVHSISTDKTRAPLDPL